jgi:hypothetical protein
MPDQTITETPLADGRVRYDLGPANWAAPSVPDIRQPGSTVPIPQNRLIDVVILGDGHLSAAEFRQELDRWLPAFLALKVYSTFAGAIRVRALYTPSTERASSTRGSYYGCVVNDAGDGIVKDDTWLSSGDPDAQRFRDRFWEAVDSFGDVNLRAYPPEVDLGPTPDRLRGVYRNLVVSMLVRTAARTNVSGMTTEVHRDDDHLTRTAFGANSIHELSHALGILLDEYIDGRDGASDRANPSPLTVYNLCNLSYDDADNSVPWLHLMPTGRFRRVGAGADPSPVVGWLWAGGVKHTGVWHSEYQCLMNGSHDNFAYTQTAAADPTANPDGTYTDENGADLRDTSHFCAWCTEILTIRLLEKTDQFSAPGDPADPVAQGSLWYDRWVDELRENYYALLDIENQIHDAEARYAAEHPGRAGEALWTSDLYSPPKASPPPPQEPVPPLTDAETLLLSTI